MTETNHSEIALQAVLNQSQSVRNINRDIDKIKGQIKPLPVQVKPDEKSLQSFERLKKELLKWSRNAAIEIGREFSAKFSNEFSAKISSELPSSMSSGISNTMTGAVSSQVSAELETTKADTENSLSSMLDTWSNFGEAVEKTLKSPNIVSDFNSLLGMISSLSDTAKDKFGSLGTIELGTGLFGMTKFVNYFVKNFA